MTARDNELGIERILVPLDASRNSLAALRVGAQLAAGLQAQLVGLYVEDAELMRVAQLPGASDVSTFTASVRRLELRQLERHMHRQAEAMRQAVTEIGDRLGLSHSFRVTRGGVPAQVLAAALEADLVILGRAGWSLAGERRLGSTVRTMLRDGTGMTFVMRQDANAEAPVILIYDGSPQAWKSLNAAVHLARAGGRELRILLVAAAAADRAGLQEELEQGMRVHGAAAECRTLVAPTTQHLVHLASMEGDGPLVTAVQGAVLSGEQVEELLECVRNPVLLVR